MSKSAHVIDITEQNFEAEIVEASMTLPILVDFWAEWCGPCKTLGPLLEELADSYAGAFRLAKVDVDKNPLLASQFGAQSIPMVFALYQGGLVDRFTGVLPVPQLKAFIDSVIERCGGAAGAAEDELAAQEPVDQEATLRATLEATPDDGEALLALGSLEMGRGQGRQAETLFTKIPAAATQYDQAQAKLGALALAHEVEEAGGESQIRDLLAANPESPKERYLVACTEGARANYAKALEVMVDLVAVGGTEIKGPAKKAAATLFEAAGRGDEAIEGLRGRLSRLLF